MKILFAAGTDAGIKRVRSELIIELIKKNHEVVVATPDCGSVDSLLELGCSFSEVGLQRQGRNPIRDYILYIGFLKILKRENPDLVLTFTTKANIFCGIAARKLKIPVVMNITGLGTALGEKSILQKLLIHLYRFATKGQNMKCLFFQNDDSMEFFKLHKISRESIYHRIPGSGVNLERYKVLPYPEGERLNFLFVARVMKEKGIDEYISASKYIKNKYKNIAFHVLGTCDDKYTKILETAESAGLIKYHGRIDNMIDYQKISCCTIHPSYYPEGMSNVILEAAASGRPVITTDHPGCREGVDDGITGFIVEPRNSKSLIKAIEKFIALTVEERKAMGLRGREKVEKYFDRKLITEEYLHLIQEVRNENNML